MNIHNVLKGNTILNNTKFFKNLYYPLKRISWDENK